MLFGLFQVDTVTVNPEVVNVVVSGMSIIGTIGASILLGVFKKYVLPAEGKLIEVIKPFQPVLVTVLPPLFTLAFAALGIANQEDAASMFAAAPLSAIFVISAREGLRRLVGAK